MVAQNNRIVAMLAREGCKLRSNVRRHDTWLANDARSVARHEKWLAGQEEAIARHDKWLAGHDQAVTRHEQWWAEHQQAMREMDVKLDRLREFTHESARRNTGQVPPV